MKLAPSILSADFANLERDIRLVEELGADYIHVDVMDGQFVPNITLGPNIVSAIRPVTKLPLDVHLMIVQPENYINAFAEAGADIITVHQEATPHIHRALQMIKNAGVKAGVTINPGTPLSMIENVLDLADQVLVMTVNPGFGGQSFIENSLEKIAQLKEWKETKGYTYEIEVDGGIVPETAARRKEVGAEVFVACSYIYNAENPQERIDALRAVLDK
ncbi:ribulose-phosphate 3-epimerase [Enterococcus faecalis]